MSKRVAAVCLRVGAGGVEFLLVKTTGGLSTFPRGRIERRLGPALSAGREALEEAGALGALAPSPFGFYIDCRPNDDPGSKPIRVDVFLMEVTVFRAAAAEARRRPTWMTSPDAKLALASRRPEPFRSTVLGIVDQAVSLV